MEATAFGERDWRGDGHGGDVVDKHSYANEACIFHL